MKFAFAEDGAVFDGNHEANTQGIREGTSNPVKSLPDDAGDYPDAVAQALSQLRTCPSVISATRTLQFGCTCRRHLLAMSRPARRPWLFRARKRTQPDIGSQNPGGCGEAMGGKFGPSWNIQ